MEARYLLVRGVPGQLVANPHAEPHTRRMLGKKPNGIFWDAGPVDPETNEPRWPAAVPVEEVVKDDSEGYLRKMIRKGCLELVAECKAESHEHAGKKIAEMRKERSGKNIAAVTARAEK